MATVFDVAAYILNQKGELTTWKLQKLVCYSQAWSPVWDEEPLFEEDIQAWINGPVCPALYNEHKGRFTIDKGIISLEPMNPTRPISMIKKASPVGVFTFTLIWLGIGVAVIVSVVAALMGKWIATSVALVLSWLVLRTFFRALTWMPLPGVGYIDHRGRIRGVGIRKY